MNKVKLLILMLAVTSMLSLGTPAPTRARGALEMPPSIVFVQNKGNGMLLSHNFTFDDWISVDIDDDMDDGFYVYVQPYKN
jgi:hypothetical protein